MKTDAVQDFAYYYSDWIWAGHSVEFMKSMLLFFDGIALSLPPDLLPRVIEREPILAIPLFEQGLLVNFDPSTTLDKGSANRLASTLTNLVEDNPGFWKHRDLRMGELTCRHWGGNDAAALAFQKALSQRGLIRKTRFDNELFMLDEKARLLVLTIFAQSLRLQLADMGVALHPATDSVEGIYDLRSTFKSYAHVYGLDTAYTMGEPWNIDNSQGDSWYTFDSMSPKQISDDLRDVGADLSKVPLDEVLDFRDQNGHHYRTYARMFRQFSVTTAYANVPERQQALQQRTAEIREHVAQLRRVSRAAFGMRVSTLLLSLACAAWTLKSGDPIGALLAGASASTQAIPTPERQVNAYSYLMGIRHLRRA